MSDGQRKKRVGAVRVDAVSDGVLAERYAAGPTAVEEVVREFTAAEMRSRPIPGKWSALEVVCHITDTEQIFADRIKRTVAMNRPLLMGADAPNYVEALGYRDRVLHEELGLIELTRTQLARTLRAIPAAAWQRTAIHSEIGLVSVRDLVALAIGHLEHHLEAIREKRKAFLDQK